jgi:tRNA(Ile)-lysidine synthase
MGGRLDTAVADVRRAIRQACGDVEPGMRVIVACSGGADSMALAAGAVFEGRHAGWSVGAVTIDHQLQKGSGRVAADVAERLEILGCDPVDVITVAVGSTGGPEGAARAARYAALETLAVERGAVVLLGHTRDDQAESVLLGLARGSGTRSLAGMARRRGCFRRPLLGLSRSSTEQACRAQGLVVWSDPHNDDQRFTRVRVRHEVLPLLERELGPGVGEALARTADLARDDADALDALARDLAQVADRGSGCLDVAVLATAAPAVRRRVLRTAAIEAGCAAGDLTGRHVAEIDRLVTDWHGQAQVDLPGHVTATRRPSGSTAHLHLTQSP